METSQTYYASLTISYAVALLGWIIINRTFKSIWPDKQEYQFNKPWVETILVLLCGVLTMAIGQLYTNEFLFKSKGSFSPQLFTVINNILIFSPFILLLVFRRQPLSTAWLSSQNLIAKIAAGLILSISGLTTFYFVSGSPYLFRDIVYNVYNLQNLGLASQVFLEDFVIAILVVRLSSALGKKWTIITILSAAFLFSVSHYPIKFSGGLSFFAATMEVIIDMALVAGVLIIVKRSKDIIWFFFVHFALDMVQFFQK